MIKIQVPYDHAAEFNTSPNYPTFPFFIFLRLSSNLKMAKTAKKQQQQKKKHPE